jgi:hypothetical protein
MKINAGEILVQTNGRLINEGQEQCNTYTKTEKRAEGTTTNKNEREKT